MSRTNRHKIISIFLTILILFNICASVNASDFYNTPQSDQDLETATPTPKIKMSSDGMFSLKANSEQDIEVTLKNVSAFYAYNILVQAKAEGENVPFTMSFVDNSNVKYSLQNSVTFKTKIHIKVNKNATDGTYPVTLNYNYSAKDKTGYSESDTIYIRIENDLATPIVTLSDFKADKDKVKAGENITVSALMQNISEFDASNVKLSLSGFESDKIGLSDGSSTTYFKEYNSGYKNELKFNFNTNEDMKGGSYPITFNLKYYDKAGKEYENEFQFYINVTDGKAKDEDKDINIDAEVTTPVGVYKVGEKFDVKVKIKNNGKDKAENIKISAVLPDGGQIVPRTASVTQIKELLGGETGEVTFSFSATAESKSQNYSIGFNIEYKNGQEDENGAEIIQTFNQYTGVNITNPEGDKKDDDKSDEEKKVSAPKIIISKYECNPLIVEAGKKFDIDMVFQNTNSQKTVKNIKLFLTVDDQTEEKGNVFSPDNASNTFYIDEIAPKGQVSHTFHMYTVPDAKARTYTIKVNFEYEDAEANQYTSTELVGINVKQSAKLDLGEINLPEIATVGEQANISFELYNTGKVTLSNLMVKTEGNFNTTGSSMFIGNFESGNTEYYEGVITPTEVGEVNGKVIISYEDTNGEYVERVQEFTMNVEEAYTDDMNMDFPEEDNTVGKNKKVVVGVIVGVVIVAMIVGIILRKRIKRKKELELNE